MSLFLGRARDYFRKTRDHIQNNDRYRFYPVYSVLLALVVWSFAQWPFTDGLVVTYVEHRWIFALHWTALEGALWLSLILAFIGVLRKGWIPKVIAAITIYYSAGFLYWLCDGPTFEDIWLDVSWYVFDVPIAMLSQFAGEDEFALTTVYAVYLFFVWILLRPFVKLGWTRIQRLEGFLVSRYPILRGLQKPII
jgi:hypothetical protein